MAWKTVAFNELSLAEETMESSQPPLVSVVMPVLNPDPSYFPLAVRSVLKQTFQDLELIIVEDPSPRKGQEFLAQFGNDSRIRHIQNSARSSLVGQLNQGLSLARGEYIARFDADDICEPCRLEKQLAWLSAHPEVDVLGSQLCVIDETGEVLGYRTYPNDHDTIVATFCRYNALGHPSVVFRRRVVEAVGGYLPCVAAEDYDLWSRLAIAGYRLANHPEALIRYRVHSDSVSKRLQLRDFIRATLDIKKKYWRGRMPWSAKLRMWGERCLLILPPGLVVKLFMRTQVRANAPSVPEKP